MSDSEFKFDKYPMQIVLDPDGSAYASLPDLPGFSVMGDSLEDAQKKLREKTTEWLAETERLGLQIPGPEQGRTYSGRFVLRLDPVNHEDLSKKAKRQNISLNQLIQKLIQAGQKAVEHEEIMQSLNEIKELCSATDARVEHLRRAGKGAFTIIVKGVEDYTVEDVVNPNVAFVTDQG